MKKLPVALLLMTLLMLWSQRSSSANSKREKLNSITNVFATQGSPCFAIDPGIGNTNRDDHYRWARQQDSTKLMNNLAWKIGILFNCSSVSGDDLAKGFGQMSGIIGDYVSNPACFNNDPHVTGRDRSAHEQWARTKTREQVRDNLQWKAVATMKCLNRDNQVAFFADESVALAGIPSSSGRGGCGLGTRWDETEEGWTATWTRQGSSNVFGVRSAKGKMTLTAVQTITINGNQVSVRRTNSSDGNDCGMEGIIAQDGVTVTGTYHCSSGGPYDWRATIRCN